MSIIPNKILFPVSSLELKTFGIKININSTITKIDIFTTHMAFWKSIVLRNTNAVTALQYRTEPHGEYQIVNQDSEIIISGWGSYFEVLSPIESPTGMIEFECVKKEDATQNAK